jgi:hypothetical protein
MMPFRNYFSHLKRLPLLVSIIIILQGKISTGQSNDSTTIKVHFLYGSKPAKKYKHQETDWFGGKLGGHVGIETAPNVIFDFIPSGDFHVFAHREERHSKFTRHTPSGFWQIFGSHADSVKQMTIVIPVSNIQKTQLDSIFKAYTNITPYDYAFWGMRCGAAAYDVLAHVGIVKTYSYRKTYRKIFYPRRLRRRLIALAENKNWTIVRQQGTERRKWENE